jgi:hypothetical protein
MSKPIPNPEPNTKYFCLAFPAPGSYSKVLEEEKIITFQDPETGKEYQAVIEDMLRYPEYFLSEMVCKMALDKPAAEVRRDMMVRFHLNPGDEIAIVQFKKLTNE